MDRCFIITIVFYYSCSFVRKDLMVGNSTNEHAPKHVFNNSRQLGDRVGRCMSIDVK